MPNVLNVTQDANSVNLNQQSIRPQTTGVGASGVNGSRNVTSPGISTNGIPSQQIEQEAAKQVDFESNYASFVQLLQEGSAIPEDLSQLIFGDGMSMLLSGDEEMSPVMQELFSSIVLSDPSELVSLLQDTGTREAKYSGTFFDGMRSLLSSDKVPENLKENAAAFLKAYNSYAAGSHNLAQMKTLSEQISKMMFSSSRKEFDALLDRMDWNAPLGSTKQNEELLNGQILPFLSKYVSKTHDYGAIRNAIVLFSLYTVKYEEGSNAHLQALYDKLISSNLFKQTFQQLGVTPERALMDKLTQIQEQAQKPGFSDALSELVLKGTQGKVGSDATDQFQAVMKNMLLNESVYMPVMHMVIPFRYQNQNVTSELWVDPDAGKKDATDQQGTSGKLKLFLKFHMDRLGDFDMIIYLKDRKDMDMQLFVPEKLPVRTSQITKSVNDILTGNGFDVTNLAVKQRAREISVEEVFPEIYEKENSINVRV